LYSYNNIKINAVAFNQSSVNCQCTNQVLVKAKFSMRRKSLSKATNLSNGKHQNYSMTSPDQTTQQVTQSPLESGPDRVAAKPVPRIRPVPAVSRSIAILRLLGKARGPLGVNAIAHALGLVPSTCLHILRALVEEKLVAFDRQTKHYRLGIGMLALARSALDSNAFPALIQAGLDQLSTAYNVTAIAVDVTDADQMVVVALSRSTIPFRLHVDVGSVFPSLLSATGRLVAAFSQQSRAELKAQFAKLRWDGSINFDTWYLEVQQAMQNEYSIDRGTYIAGVTIVAVPVRQQNKMPTHTLVCASLTNQLTEADLTDLIMRMRLQADLATSL